MDLTHSALTHSALTDSAFTDSAEQAALREAVRDFFSRYAAGFDQAAWRRLTGELGLTALPVPENLGGVGATLAEVAVVLEEAGRVLLAAPYLSTALAAAVLARAAPAAPDAARAYLPGLAGGTLVGALALDADVTVRDGTATGTAAHVVDGPVADLLIVRAGDSLVAARAGDVRVEPFGTLDPTRPQARVRLDRVPVLPVSAGDGGELARWARDALRTALAVESVGAARHCLDTTVAYLKQRTQFGRRIGEFQALRHRCADLAVEVESAGATSRAAVWTAVHDPAELAVLGPLAKRYCADVFAHTAAEMIQLHGGIGFTWEHEAHRYFKRAKSTQLMCGSPAQLRRLVARRAGLT
jgi:alkylation response protein AidB-like acyl-CoA dehydrogenase